MYDRILEEIKNSDMILVGVGAEASFSKPLNLHDEMTQESWKQLIKSWSAKEQENILLFYNRLADILEKKNYFVITTNVDGQAFESKLNPIRIVAPCGNIHHLQCRCDGMDGIVAMDQIEWDTDDTLCCEKCGSTYVPNIFNPMYYNEEGYLKQWNLYNKWLQGTLNKKLFVLEIGCDFSFLSIIRMPFEKIVLINQKASYCRVSGKFPQITAQLKERMFSVEQDPFTFAAELEKKRQA